MPKPRIALISEHASPLALLGGVDSGGQGNGRVHMRILPRNKGGAATGGDKPAEAGNAGGTGEGT